MHRDIFTVTIGKRLRTNYSVNYNRFTFRIYIKKTVKFIYGV